MERPETSLYDMVHARRMMNMENETESKKSNLYKLYIGMYMALIIGFIWYVVPLSTGQKSGGRGKDIPSVKTNTVQFLEDDHETDDDEDEAMDEHGKVRINPSDLDLKSKKQYPSDEEYAKMIVSKDEKTMDLLDDILRDIAFDEKWSEMSRAVEVLNSIDGWQTNVTEETQLSFLSALKDFMPFAAAEVVPFLASSHEEVREMSMSEMADFIDDSDDDNLIASLIVKLSSLVDDSDFADSLVLKIDNMETDVAALTMLGIIKNGSDTFKKSLAENIEYITEQTEVSEEAILKWAVEKKKTEETDDE